MNELQHYGVKGMKWGHRKKREYTSSQKASRRSNKDDKKANMTPEEKAARRKKALKIGAAAVGTTLAAYGAYKVSKLMKEKAFDKAYNRSKAASDKASDYYYKRRVEPLYGTKHFGEAQAKYNKLVENFVDSDMRYAKKASRNVIAAGKELLDKNNELPLGQIPLVVGELGFIWPVY